MVKKVVQEKEVGVYMEEKVEMHQVVNAEVLEEVFLEKPLDVVVNLEDYLVVAKEEVDALLDVLLDVVVNQEEPLADADARLNGGGGKCDAGRLGQLLLLVDGTTTGGCPHPGVGRTHVTTP